MDLNTREVIRAINNVAKKNGGGEGNNNITLYDSIKFLIKQGFLSPVAIINTNLEYGFSLLKDITSIEQLNVPEDSELDARYYFLYDDHVVGDGIDEVLAQIDYFSYSTNVSLLYGMLENENTLEIEGKTYYYYTYGGD